jgi:hypothetical protein
MSPCEREIVPAHEAGHAIVASVFLLNQLAVWARSTSKSSA